MPEAVLEQFKRWKVDETLITYPGLRLRPTPDGSLLLAGTLRFTADADGLPRIDDVYDVEISIPPGFPHDIPIVKETGGRIPSSFHTNGDGSLCLGAPVRLRLLLTRSPTLIAFLERCVIPFLYGFSYYTAHGVLPFGELQHGNAGLCSDFAELFGVAGHRAAVDMLRYASLKKRDANKRRCPCGSGRPLGRCHNRRVNLWRKLLGRSWFREQWLLLSTSVPFQPPVHGQVARAGSRNEKEAWRHR